MSLAERREAWIAATNNRPLTRALGITGHDYGAGYVEQRIVPTPVSDDGRGSVLSFAITVSADLCVLGAVITTLDEAVEETNGTAALSMNYVDAPRSAVLVRGEVVHHGRNLRLIEITATDEGGRVVARGRGSYAVRQKRVVAK